MDNFEVPFVVRQGLLSLPIRNATQKEIESCRLIQITSDLPWCPEEHNESDVTKATQTSEYHWNGQANSESTIRNVTSVSELCTTVT